MSKPPTFHSFSRLTAFMTRFYKTPIVLRILALLFMLVLAMLVEAVKTGLHKNAS